MFPMGAWNAMDKDTKRQEVYRKLSQFDKFYQFLEAAKTRMKKIINAPYSSESVTLINQTIFFDIFMQIPVVIGDNIFVAPAHWATAFMQFGIGNIASVLFRAVLENEDLLDGDASGGGKNLMKILAVKRAAKWMLKKDQDPWSWHSWPFRSDVNEIELNHILTEDENLAIENAYENVRAKRIMYPVFHVPSALREELKTTGLAELSSEEESNCYNQYFPLNVLHSAFNLTEDPMNILSDFETQCLPDFSEWKDYDDATFFIKVMKLRLLGNAAQTARELTKITIPGNDEVFIDATQFSRSRFDNAAKKTGMVKMAEHLFRKHWGRTCKFSSFKSIQTICPVTRLAVIRGAKWLAMLANNQTGQNILDFDSAEEHHNVNFSETDVRDVENILEKYVGMLCGDNGEFKKDPAYTPELDVELDNDNLSFSSNGDALRKWLDSNLSPDMEILFENGSPPVQNVSGDAYVPQLQPTSLSPTSSASNSFEIPSIECFDKSELGVQNGIAYSNSSSRSRSSTAFIEINPSINLETQPTEPQLSTSNGITSTPREDCICVIKSVHLQIDGSRNIIIGDGNISMPLQLWNEAYTKLSTGSSFDTVGRKLFKRLFSKETMPEETKDLCPIKKQWILESLEFMKMMTGKGWTISSYDDGMKHAVRVHKWSALELGYFEVKIFEQSRNRFKKSKRKPRKGSSKKK